MSLVQTGDGKMNLAKLFEMQNILDNHIETEHPRKGEEDRLSGKILALQVELGECANEWRGFKFWSNDQDSRTFGFKYYEFDEQGNPTKWEQDDSVNPLLEEYVDCLHFILSIGLESSEEWLIDANYNIGGFEKHGWNIKNTIEQFQVVFSKISDFSITNDANDFVDLVSEFIGLGEMLGFTWDQVEKAYFDKNSVNHQRQEQGY
jgi:dimeric dUTPase (all-alpha-NTP-PPase superfamily)